MSTNDPERHRLIKELFGELIELPEADRPSALGRICGADVALRADLESLIEHAAAPRVAVDPGSTSVRAAIESIAEEIDHGDDEIPAQIGAFTILGVLGQGGMGVVYLAEQASPRRTVALKVIRSGVGGRMVLRRFRREAELLARVQHPNIAQVHAAGTAQVETPRGPVPLPYFAMEYVKGVPITEHCGGRGHGVRERVAMMAVVCDAVEHAHRAGILHRDLKPANVLVDERGAPRVLDFGIARPSDEEHAAATLRTEASEIVGTLPYMSPEQCSGRPNAVDRRSDVYALGVMLYELLVGRLPLDLSGQSVVEAARIVAETEPPSLASVDRSLRGDLDTIVGKCLAKDPDRRYQTADQLRQDLERHLDDRPIEARPPSTIYQLRKFTRRHRGLVAGIAVAFAAMVVATFGSGGFAVDAHRSRLEAEARLDRMNVEMARSAESFRVLSSIILGANPHDGGRPDMTVVEMLDRSAERLLSDESDQPHVSGMVIRLVGTTYFRLGELEKAAAMQLRAVEVLRRSDWPDDTMLVSALLDLGNTRQAQARYAEAAEAIEEAVRLVRSSPAGGEGSVSLGAVLNDLGLLRQSLGDFSAAVEAYDESIRVRTERGEVDSPQIATTLVNLGSTLLLSGAEARAEPILRDALERNVRHLGETNQTTLQGMNNLAVALRRLGRYEEAIRLQERVVRVRREALPPTHYEQSAALSNLAHFLALSGRADLALPTARAALEGRLATLGDAHPSTGRTRLVLAGALLGTGAIDEARREIAKATETIRRTHAPAHWMVVDALIERARIENEAGEATSAAECAREAIALLPAGDGPFRAPASEQLALAQWRAGDWEAASGALRECLAIRRRVSGDGHPETADVVCMIGVLETFRADERGSTGRVHEINRLLEELAQAAMVYRTHVPSAAWRAALATVIGDELRRATGRSMSHDGAEARSILASAPVRLPWWAAETVGSPSAARSQPGGNQARETQPAGTAMELGQ